jgi:XTP/dITP diphosphohydrolase
MTTFVLATANPHKADEMRAVMNGLNIELLTRPVDIANVEETEDTLEGNALLKARAVMEATGLAAIADDTGLFVDGLQGRPGVFSARYAGERATDEENVQKLLGELMGVDVDARQAQFRTVIAVAYPVREPDVVLGTLEGVIVDLPRGTHGFGYDPVFAPVGEGGRTLAELSTAEKNSISHRATALRKLSVVLAQR